jgi:membrane associated rhomboid family serine protease
MRDSYGRPSTSIVTWMMSVLVAGFILESIFLRWFPDASVGRSFMRAFVLSAESIRSGHVWTLLSYSLLHDPENFFHLIGNLLGLYFLGRELLPYLGSRRFLGLCSGGVLLGGLAWLGVHWQGDGTVLGASAAVSALLVVFACLNPNQPITLLLFFVIPIRLKPKYLALGLFAIAVFGLLFLELPRRTSGNSIAHSAHLGGMLAGWLYFRFVHQREWLNADRSAASIELPRWFRRTKKSTTTPAPFKINLTPPKAEDLRTEVDRILDKINCDGFGALTTEEKRILDSARDALNKR